MSPENLWTDRYVSGRTEVSRSASSPPNWFGWPSWMDCVRNGWAIVWSIVFKWNKPCGESESKIQMTNAMFPERRCGRGQMKPGNKRKKFQLEQQLAHTKHLNKFSQKTIFFDQQNHNLTNQTIENINMDRTRLWINWPLLRQRRQRRERPHAHKHIHQESALLV